MGARKKQEIGRLDIMDAVEALESIADLDFDREVEFATEEEINEHNKQVTLKAVKWLGKEDPEDTARLVKETFRVVLDYLRSIYDHESGAPARREIVEGAKTIMVLVGDAAQKLDKYTTLFKHTKAKSVKLLQEYKQLQEFYLTRIAKKIDEGLLGKWILELTKGVMTKRAEEAKREHLPSISTRHVFMDLDSVKKDTEYELFFLRKEDGTRFFNPRLIRNIKLVCDFGESMKRERTQDPLENVKLWQDFAFHVAAKELVASLGALLDRYIHETRSVFKREIVADLNKAIVALLMSANPKNLLEHAPLKSCQEYFTDFLYFLRQALVCREYQRLLAFPPKKHAKMALTIIDITQVLAGALFSGMKMKELAPVLQGIFSQARAECSDDHLKEMDNLENFWCCLAGDFKALNKLLAKHSNGPLEKVLSILEPGSDHFFDPVFQKNFPFQLFSLYLKGKRAANLHLPSPTWQEFIHKAEITEEFKTFLRYLSKGQLQFKHLFFNLQDRTSWKEHARSKAIEELQKSSQFDKTLTVVTFAKDTEFYHQAPPYNHDNQTHVFIKHLMDHLGEEACGFYFPQWLKKKLFPKFVENLAHAVHKVFFGSMNVLTVNNRKDFIEIFYFFLQLKIIEIEMPDTFSFTCKDGVDIGGMAAVEFYALMKVLAGESSNKQEIEGINMIAHLPSLLNRERVVFIDRFDRMIAALRRVETAKEEMGEQEFKKIFEDEFGKLFDISMIKEAGIRVLAA